MSLPKQLINLLGLVVVIAVLAIGGALVAAPLYSQSLSTDADTARVAQTNAQYDAQVQSLLAAKKELPSTKKEVAALRKQIAVPNHLDDVFELAVLSAEGTGSTITNVTAGDVIPFIARTSTDGSTGPAATSETSDEDAAASSSLDAASTASATSDDARQQASFTITVEVPSPEAAADFLDGLREGPRLVAMTHSALEDSNGQLELTVDALAFISPAE